MRQRPMTAAAVNPAMAQQEREQLLAFAAQIVGRRLAGANQVAHRFMRRVRHPYPGQLAGPMQPRQRHRIAPVGLDPLARPLRDQRRRHHHAGMAESLDLAIQPVPGRPRLVAEMQLAVAAGQLADQPLHRRPANSIYRRETAPRCRARHRQSPPHASSSTMSKATNASLYSPMVRPPCMRLGSACPSNPRFSFARIGRAAASARGHNV